MRKSWRMWFITTFQWWLKEWRLQAKPLPWNKAVDVLWFPLWDTVSVPYRHLRSCLEIGWSGTMRQKRSNFKTGLSLTLFSRKAAVDGCNASRSSFFNGSECVFLFVRNEDSSLGKGGKWRMRNASRFPYYRHTEPCWKFIQVKQLVFCMEMGIIIWFGSVNNEKSQNLKGIPSFMRWQQHRRKTNSRFLPLWETGFWTYLLSMKIKVGWNNLWSGERLK